MIPKSWHLFRIAALLFLTAVPLAKTTAADLTNYVESLPGSSIKFKMIAIPGGDFYQGTTVTDPQRGTNDLDYRHTHVDGFWLAECETTWALAFLYLRPPDSSRGAPLKHEDRAILYADGFSRPSEIRYLGEFGEKNAKTHPAGYFSLTMAQEFCKWLSFRTGHEYRLPTEAEWEYACRAGSTNTYYWGDDTNRLAEYAWAGVDDIHPIAKLKPNAFGLYDMLGNVAEWCDDGSTNPLRVVRGGAYNSTAKDARSASRLMETPEWNDYDFESPPSKWILTTGEFVGFRVARSFKNTPASPATNTSAKPLP